MNNGIIRKCLTGLKEIIIDRINDSVFNWPSNSFCFHLVTKGEKLHIYICFCSNYFCCQEKPNTVCFAQINDLQPCKVTMEHLESMRNGYINNVLVYEDPTTLKMFPMKYHFGCQDHLHNNNTPEPGYYSVCNILKPLESNVYLTKDNNCNQNLPPIAFGQGLFYPIEFYGTLFHWEYFWAIKLLLMSNSNECSLQTRFLLNGLVHFQIAKMSRLVRYHYNKNSHRNVSLHALPSEKEKEFIKLLRIFASSANMTGFKNAITDSEELQVILDWFDVLHFHVYPVEQIWQEEETKKFKCINKYRMFYNPTKITSPKGTTSIKQRIHKTYKVLCARGAVDFNRYLAKPVFENILLVVIFNHPAYHSIPIVELIYGLFFPNIIFCGPSLPSRNEYPYFYGKRFTRTFLEYHSFGNGDTSYECAILVISAGYKMDGYFFLTSDSLFDLRKFEGLPKSKAWLPSGGEILDLTLKPFPRVYKPPDFNNSFRSTHQFWYTQQYYKFFVEYQSQKDETVINCRKSLSNFTESEWRLYGTPNVNHYYIPKSIAKNASTILRLFSSMKICSEIAVPSSLLCLTHSDRDTNQDKLSYISDMIPQNKQRQYPWEFIPAEKMFKYHNIHPLSLEMLYRPHQFKDKHFLSAVSFLCSEILPVFNGIKQPSKKVYIAW